MNPLREYEINGIKMMLKKCEGCDRLTSAKNCCGDCVAGQHTITCNERHWFRSHFTQEKDMGAWSVEGVTRVGNKVEILNDKYDIISKKNLSDGTVGVVLYRKTSRRRTNGDRISVRAKYILGRLLGTKPETLEIRSSTEPGRQAAMVRKGMMTMLERLE